VPPKSVVYHICGQHLSGEALCGYQVTPDTAVMLSPKLTLKGGVSAAKHWEPAAPMPPKLFLYGKGITLSASSSLAVNEATLYLRGGKTTGKWPALLPTLPGSATLLPTDDEDILLVPTDEGDSLLVPTSERDV